MARVNYGSTPWGGYFLDALNRFYRYDARVGRGKTYANTGKVYDLAIATTKIKAKVKGNWDPYYNVSLVFEPLAEKQVKQIYEIIDNNPLILASIINGELPSSLLELLQKEGIELFPQNFNNLKTKCSCPDWGDPCKHMAGVYFVLTAMIDNNPFLLFEIRGIDMISHYHIKEEIDISYPLSLDFAQNESFENKDIELIKFDNFKDFILSKLSSNPPFMNIDFHKLLDEFYRYAKRFFPTVFFPALSEHNEHIERIFKSAEFRFDISSNLIDSHVKITHPLLTPQNISKLFGKEEKNLTLTYIELINLFLAFEYSSGNAHFNYLYFLSRIVYLLIEANGFIFDLLKIDDSYYGIAKPLLSPISVQKQLALLEEITPPIALFENSFLDQKSTSVTIMSVILSQFVKTLQFPMKKGANDRINIAIFDLLFRSKSLHDNFELQDKFRSLDRYFTLFDLLDCDVEFKIIIEKKGENYTLELLANDKNLYKITDSKEKLQVYKLVVKFADTLLEIETLTRKKEILLSFEMLEHFILEQKETMLDLGISVVIPKELQTLLRPKLKIKAQASSKNLKSFLSLDKLLEYDFFLSIGDEKISAQEFKKLIKEGRKIIQFKEHFVYLDPKEIDQLFKQMEKQKKLNSFDLLHLNFNDELELDETLKAYLDDIFTTKEYPLPPINATLREYQHKGFLWAINNLLNGFGVIFADDMGLGKTVQTIAVIYYLKLQKYITKPVLIVVPTTLLNNWAREIDKFAPSLSYSAYYGQNRLIQKSDIIFTTYQILRRDKQIIKKQKFDMIVIDEAQNIKNPLTETAKSIKEIKAPYKIALSGTPVENNLSELWSIFDFALPRYLKTLKDFQKTYAKEIEINLNKTVAKRLKNITSPFMLRRLKSDKSIIKDLPQKIVIDQYITMEKEQAVLYQSVIDTSLDTINNGEPKDRSGLIFKLLISLKQICNHPRNFDKTSVTDYRTSGKTKVLIQLLETIIEADEKVLIFTQYTQMGDILEEIIKKELFTEPLYLKGSLSKNKRDALIESFDNDKEKKIFILSLKAGGVGLNLTKANNVIHYDLWFNPAVENQATDRAFRIGQKKNVNVFRFITQNSFEEKIDKMIKAKQELQDLSVSVGEKWIGNMSDEELKMLF